MGWGIRKSIKIAPGVRFNLSKSGISTSIGGNGFTYNSRGRITASIPGTGIRYTHNLNARRTAHPIRSVVAGSHHIDSASTERLSKREQATQELAGQIQRRATAALLQYFTSHGVYVRANELAEAVTLEDHQPFLDTLSREFEATTKAIKLAVDIGTISLAEKEKAMLALYEIERKCAERHGDRGQIETAAASLSDSALAWPTSPTFAAPCVMGILGSLFLFLSEPAIGLILLVVAAAYGVYSLRAFGKKQAVVAEQFAEANARFDSLLTVELSARPELPVGDDYVQAKAVGFAVVIGVIALCAVLYKPQHADDRAAASASVSGNADSAVASSKPDGASSAGQRQADFNWLVGKHPADVVNDRRFRAAFNHASRGDWKKIVERLAVADAAGIALKNGYFVGQGCKAHFCESDVAAFAINAATGKGDLVFKQTVDYTSGKFVAKRIVWSDMPLELTPLADWGKLDEAATGSTASTVAADTTLRTSFDCAKAHSDAEQLICHDPELAAADVELAAIYAKAKSAAVDQNAFRQRTRAEWNYREEHCHDRDCVARWYTDQTTALTQIAATGKTDEN